MSEPELTVHKASAYVPISDELAMEYGLIPDTRPPLPPPSLRTRLRWRISALRERLAGWLCRVVAGYEMDHRDN